MAYCDALITKLNGPLGVKVPDKPKPKAFAVRWPGEDEAAAANVPRAAMLLWPGSKEFDWAAKPSKE